MISGISFVLSSLPSSHPGLEKGSERSESEAGDRSERRAAVQGTRTVARTRSGAELVGGRYT